MQLKLIGVLLCLLFSANILANYPKLDSVLYHPFPHAKDLYFQLKSPSLNNVIEQKQLVKDLKAKKVDVYKLGKTVDINYDFGKVFSKQSDLEFRNIILSKIKFVWLDSISGFLKQYKYEDKEDGWYRYIDETGIQDIKEVLFRFNKKILSLKIRKENFQKDLEFHYVKKKWSNGKLVLNSLSSVLVENGQEVKTTTNLDYIKYRKNLWVPSQITMSVNVKSGSLDGDMQSRSFEEVYYFSNFKINQKIATDWFKSHKYSLKK